MSSPVIDVVCLCADWCGTCREYASTFEALEAHAPVHRYRWIDIEDESDLVGDVDVETFPTLMLSWQGTVLFAGPVLPGLPAAERLLAAQTERVSSWQRQGVQPGPQALGLPADQGEAFQALATRLNSGVQGS